MIFYIATDAEGRRHLVATQADAKAIDRTFVPHDIPTDKANLMAYVQGLITEIDTLREDAMQGVNIGIATGIEISGSAPAEALGEPQERYGNTGTSGPRSQEPPPVRPEPEPQPTSDDMTAWDATRLAPIVLGAVERLGELGETGFEAIDARQGKDGAGGSFSRGVHILSVLCTGDHQLTRMLFRARQENRKYGSKT